MTSYERDTALYEVISKHGGVRPVVFTLTPEEWTAFAAYCDEVFRFEPRAKVETDAKHAPLFRAIRRSAF